jgi:ADP-heptose:LPS heptosyltransferase
LISPSCSKTDKNRRLDDQSWRALIDELLEYSNINKITIIFDSILDSQYQYLSTLKSTKVCLKVTTTFEYFSEIKNSDLIITIDSQTLHIAQYFKINTIAIYGPTNPFGISLKNTTYIISNGLTCSPCTHKYLKTPCNDINYCMKFKYFFKNYYDKN